MDAQRFFAEASEPNQPGGVVSGQRTYVSAEQASSRLGAFSRFAAKALAATIAAATLMHGAAQAQTQDFKPDMAQTGPAVQDVQHADVQNAAWNNLESRGVYMEPSAEERQLMAENGWTEADLQAAVAEGQNLMPGEQLDQAQGGFSAEEMQLMADNGLTPADVQAAVAEGQRLMPGEPYEQASSEEQKLMQDMNLSEKDLQAAMMEAQKLMPGESYVQTAAAKTQAQHQKQVASVSHMNPTGR